MKFCLKVTLCMLGLLSLLYGVGGSLLISRSFHSSLSRERESAYNAYQMVLGTLQVVSSINGQINENESARTLEQLSNQNAGAWTALRLYTPEQRIYEYNAAELPASAALPQPGNCTIEYVHTGDQAHQLTLSGALEAGGVILYLDMARDITPLLEARQAQQQTFQWIFLLLTLLCALLSYSIAHILTKPLASLSKASRAISTGQFSCRARIDSGDEIGLLARDFNSMAESLERNISALQESVERQERFMASFAHEVKTPMTSIIGYADLLRGQTLQADEQLQAAHYIVAEGKRLENLSQKLMDVLVLAQHELRLTPSRPAALILGLCEHLKPLYLKRGITISCDCAEGRCLLEPDLVKSLLINLLDNAQKAMDGQAGEIHIRLDMLADGCQISVQDSGRGIPPAALDHLTEAFYRVDQSRTREQGGVGLGLALCQEIVALHKGSIRFDSQLGAGTTVTLTLKAGVLCA